MSDFSATPEPSATDWVVITGPPSSGKTTMLELFAADDQRTSPDSTRALIAEVVAEGRDPEEFRFAPDFQPRTLAAMLAKEDRLEPGERTFLEYALPCNIAFHRTEELPLTEGLAAAAVKYRYAGVFILDPLDWVTDDERVEGEAYQRAVHAHMHEVYAELGYEPIRVPVLPPAARFEFIFERADP